MVEVSKTYSYKPSGVEWLGDIPEHWKATKLKRVVSEALKYGANESAELEDRNLPRYIRITDFGDDGKLKDDTFKSLPLEKADQYPLEDGDILFARSGATVGKTFQFKNYNGKACYAGYLIKAKPCHWIVDSDFLYYFTKSTAYDEWKNLIFTQATIQNIGADKYQYLPITLPPLPEQKAIASYLDKATQKIDHIIQIKEEQLEKMEEMRKAKIQELVTKGIDISIEFTESRISSLGVYPCHWRFIKLKLITKRIGDGIHSTPEYTDGEKYFFINGNNLVDGKITLKDNTRTVSKNEFNRHNLNLSDNTVLLSINGTIGNVALYNGEEVVLGKSAAYIEALSFINPKYLYFQLQTEYIKDMIELSLEGTTVRNLSLNTIRNLKVLLPPLDEQLKIVSKLDLLMEKFQISKTNIQTQIQTLQAYRKSLIHECVTGKKQVCEPCYDSGKPEKTTA